MRNRRFVFVIAGVFAAMVCAITAKGDIVLSPQADATINKQTADVNYGGYGAITIRANAVNAWKGYLRFDLSSVPIEDIESMTLTLGASNSNGTTAGVWNSQTVSIYGLDDVSWGEGTGTVAAPVTDTTGSTITWNSAPANDTASNSGFGASALLLTSFSAEGTTGAYAVTLDGEALDTLLASTTSSITFLLSTTGTANMSIGSRTGALALRPSLSIAVPEPGSAGIIFLASATLLLGRRRGQR